MASCALQRAIEPSTPLVDRASAANVPPLSEAADAAPPPFSCASAAGASGEGLGEPVFTPDILRLRAQAQQRVLRTRDVIQDEHGHALPAPRSSAGKTRAVSSKKGNASSKNGNPSARNGNTPSKNGNALGRFVPIENERFLAPFHGALEQLASGCGEGDKLRIAVYGASHTQADIYTSYLRQYLQARFGNAGQGFVGLAQAKGANRKLDYKVDTVGFRAEFAQNTPEPGRFGLLGAASVSIEPDAAFKIAPRRAKDPAAWSSKYELFYGAEPQGGELSIGVDGGTPVILPGNSDAPEARYHGFELPLGAHQLEIKSLGNGPTRVFGISAERSGPGIVIDTLGIGGTRASSMLAWDEELWAEHLLRRAPTLVVLAYGTNEASDGRETIPEYAEQLKAVLARMRQILPRAACLMVGPGDYPKQVDGDWQSRPRLHEVIRTQREIAPTFECAFWNTYEFMGGEGSMREWAQAKPPLGARDHVHLTRRGYVRMGMALGDALIRAYDACHKDAAAVACAAPVAPAAAADGAASRGLRAPRARNDERAMASALREQGSR